MWFKERLVRVVIKINIINAYWVQIVMRVGTLLFIYFEILFEICIYNSYTIVETVICLDILYYACW